MKTCPPTQPRWHRRLGEADAHAVFLGAFCAVVVEEIEVNLSRIGELVAMSRTRLSCQYERVVGIYGALPCSGSTG